MKKNIKNWKKAWEYFERKGYAKHDGMVLHHLDVNMKSQDPERYDQWLPEDLVPMSKNHHRALLMKLQNKKGTKRNSKEHNKKISESMRNSDIRNKKIVISRPAQEAVQMEFNSLAEAARYIGCSKQLVSQCLRPGSKNKKAYGYTIYAI